MIEWELLDDAPLPPEPEPAAPPRRRWGRWLGALAVAVLLLGAALWQQAEAQAQRLREDVTAALLDEERALRFGVAERARELSDPTAPEAWRVRYDFLFARPSAPLPVPEVVAVEPQGTIVVATLRYATAEHHWEQQRAYRLVRGQWRRSPMPPALWGAPSVHHSTHFTLWLSAHDAERLPPTELLAWLEQFHTDFSAQWPTAQRERLTLRIVPRDLLPTRLTVEGAGHSLLVNSPLLSQPEMGGLLPRQAWHSELALGVAEALDANHPADGSAQATTRSLLRDSLVRHLTLTPEAQRRYRHALAGSALDRVEGSYLADYLLQAEGAGGAATLARALGRSTSLEAALRASFGTELALLRAEVALWRSAGDAPFAPPAPGSPVQATLLRVLQRDPPLTALALVEGALVRLEGPWAASGPEPFCLGMASQLTLPAATFDGTTLHGEALALAAEPLAWRLPSLPLATVGAGTLLAHAEREGIGTLYAFDDEGYPSRLLNLPGGADVLLDSAQGELFFLTSDRCGPALGRLRRGDGVATRAALPPLRGTPQLALMGSPFVVDDASGSAAPAWLLLPEGRSAGAQVVPVAPGQRWGRLWGFRAAEGAWLVEDGDGARWWLDLGDPGSRTTALRPASLPLSAGTQPLALSPDGRWMVAHRPLPAQGSELLELLDLERGQRSILESAASQGGSRVSFHEAHFAATTPDGGLRLALSVALVGLDGQLQVGVSRYESRDGSAFVRVDQRFPASGPPHSLQPCGDTLFFSYPQGRQNPLVAIGGRGAALPWVGPLRLLGCWPEAD